MPTWRHCTDRPRPNGICRVSAGLVPPLGHRRRAGHRRAGADRSVQAGAIIGRRRPLFDLVVPQAGADEARRQVAEAAEAVAVGRVEIEAVGLDPPELFGSIGDEATARSARLSQPDRGGSARRTERCCAGGRVVDAIGDDRVGAEALDRVLKVDVPIVDREREARDEARLKHHADRLGRRLLRDQVRDCRPRSRYTGRRVARCA